MVQPLSSTSIGQLMADMRQLVIDLQSREHATDCVLAKSQIVSEKISGMKEYQEEVANMNDCWRMKGRKVLVAGLQHENRQILQLQQENRELRQAMEECETTLHLIMQRHRNIVSRFAKQLPAPVPSSRALYKKITNTLSLTEKIVDLSRLLEKCFADGENVSKHDQELIARLITENACLRELLNISVHNKPKVADQFLKRLSDSQLSSDDPDILSKKSDEEDRDGASTPTGNSIVHSTCSKGGMKRNSILMMSDRRM